MNKKLFVTLIVFLVIACIFVMKRKERFSTNNQIVIGLLQTASFIPLDEAREGFTSELKNIFGDKVKVITQNAQGSITQAQAIAASFQANSEITAFYAIATTAVQALNSEIKDRPIVFAAVTDPVGLHLREPGSNITGSTDMANIPKQISMLKELLPKIQKIAIIFNPGESNSVILVKHMKQELKKYNIVPVEVGVNSQADVAAATQYAVKNAQAILIPTDGTLTAAFPVVNQIAEKAHIPIITTWSNETEGPLMQFGVDYKQSGVQAANIMKQIIIDAKKPMDIPIVFPKSKIIISAEKLNNFDLTINETLKLNAFIM